MGLAVETRIAAMYYAAQGWSVFPLHNPHEGGCSCGNPECASPGKHPRIKGGVTRATTEPEQIAAWWDETPNANIAVCAGKAGVIILDADPRHQGDLRNLPLAKADWQTPVVLTGGGGKHIYFSAPPNVEFSNSNERLPPGIDVRTGNAYAILPPSSHISGRCYEWMDGRAPWQIPIRPLPDSIRPLLKERIPVQPTGMSEQLPVTGSDGAHHPYATAALQRELDALARATEGRRNVQLNQGAFSLGQFVQVGLLSREEVEYLLTEAALAIGLQPREIVNTINSGIEAGIDHPRRNWPDLTDSSAEKGCHKMPTVDVKTQPATETDTDTYTDTDQYFPSTVTAAFAVLHEAGVKLRLQGNKIMASPKDVITPEVANIITTYREQLYMTLRARDALENKPSA